MHVYIYIHPQHTSCINVPTMLAIDVGEGAGPRTVDLPTSESVAGPGWNKG